MKLLPLLFNYKKHKYYNEFFFLITNVEKRDMTHSLKIPTTCMPSILDPKNTHAMTVHYLGDMHWSTVLISNQYKTNF